MSLLSNTSVLLGKELRTEFRSRELLTTTVVFILMVMVLFSFTFDPTSAESRRFAPGLLVAGVSVRGIADAATLLSARAEQRHAERPAALRSGSLSRFFSPSLSANTLFLLLTELLMLPVFAVLYNVPVFPVLGELVLVLFLGSLGVSIAGTALSAISAQARMRELLLPLLLLPLLTPVLVASTEVTVGLLDAALRGVEGHRISGRFRRGVFDGAMAFRRISSGGIVDMKSTLWPAPWSFCCWWRGCVWRVSIVAPTERTMGMIQRIFYLHVSSAWTGAHGVLRLLSSRILCTSGGATEMGLAQRLGGGSRAWCSPPSC